LPIAFGNTRYIGNFLRGRSNAGAADLAQIGDAATAPHYFVKVAGSKATDMGLQEVSVETENGVEKSRTVTSTFYMLQVGNKLLVVKSKGAVTREAEGVLTPISADLDQNLFGRPRDGGRAVALLSLLSRCGVVLPAGGYWGIGIGIVYWHSSCGRRGPRARPAGARLASARRARRQVGSAVDHVGGDRARVACARQQAHGPLDHHPALSHFNRRCSGSTCCGSRTCCGPTRR